MTKIIINGIEMTPVISSCILAIGCEGESLIIRFAHAGTYSYSSGSAKLFDPLLAAPSKGKFINSILKPAYLGTLIR